MWMISFFFLLHAAIAAQCGNGICLQHRIRNGLDTCCTPSKVIMLSLQRWLGKAHGKSFHVVPQRLPAKPLTFMHFRIPIWGKCGCKFQIVKKISVFHNVYASCNKLERAYGFPNRYTATNISIRHPKLFTSVNGQLLRHTCCGTHSNYQGLPTVNDVYSGLRRTYNNWEAIDGIVLTSPEAVTQYFVCASKAEIPWREFLRPWFALLGRGTLNVFGMSLNKLGLQIDINNEATGHFRPLKITTFDADQNMPPFLTRIFLPQSASATNLIEELTIELEGASMFPYKIGEIVNNYNVDFFPQRKVFNYTILWPTSVRAADIGHPKMHYMSYGGWCSESNENLNNHTCNAKKLQHRAFSSRVDVQQPKIVSNYNKKPVRISMIRLNIYNTIPCTLKRHSVTQLKNIILGGEIQELQTPTGRGKSQILSLNEQWETTRDVILVLFASPSAVQSWTSNKLPNRIDRSNLSVKHDRRKCEKSNSIIAVAMGRTTADAAKDAGFNKIVCPKNTSVNDWISAALYTIELNRNENYGPAEVSKLGTNPSRHPPLLILTRELVKQKSALNLLKNSGGVVGKLYVNKTCDNFIIARNRSVIHQPNDAEPFVNHIKKEDSPEQMVTSDDYCRTELKWFKKKFDILTLPLVRTSISTREVQKDRKSLIKLLQTASKTIPCNSAFVSHT